MTELIKAVEVSAYQVPTETPESDGTAEWSSTTLVVVELLGGGARGLGYTYASSGAARVLRELIAERVRGLDVFDTRAVHEAAVHAVRNNGDEGLGAMAVSALDIAAWDLKARVLDLPLAQLLGMVRKSVPAYGSGGFTSFSTEELCRQLASFALQGFRFVKMKVGREPARDLPRVRAAREALPDSVQLFVDANGAYTRKQALHFARAANVSWFEEPVVRTDLEGLRMVRDGAPMEVSGGEYCWRLADFRAQCEVLDVLQADATRCGGITGFLDAHALARACELPISSHCAPALHVALGCALPGVRHLEWFFDHQRIERLLFDGAPQPSPRGELQPDLTRPGLGLELKRPDAEKFRVQI